MDLFAKNKNGEDRERSRRSKKNGENVIEIDGREEKCRM